MARMKFVQYRKAMSIVLLLFAAVPGMAAEGNVLAAPQLAQLQAQDSPLEQLQRQTREAEARAAEAEKRERDAEINRLTDQAQQAQSRADAEVQGNLAAQRELLIQQAKTELQDDAYARLEILIGVFGALITALVVFFAWNTKETAIAAAKAGVDGIRGTLEARLKEAEAVIASLKRHDARYSELLQSIAPGEAPKSAADRKTVSDAANAALARSPRDRTANEFRAIIIDLLMQKKWHEMLTVAQQMQLLHEADEDFSFARFQEAYALGQLNRNEEAIAVYDDVVARFGAAPEAALREHVARALVHKGITLGQLGRSEEEIAVYDNVVARFGAAPEAALREHVARALVSKGITLGQMGLSEEEIAVYDDVVARFGAAPEAALREEVARALVNKGITLGQMGLSEEAIAVFDDVVARFDAAPDVALREQVAMALVYKGITLTQLGRSEEAIAVYDNVVARFGAAPEAALRKLVAVAYYNKACVYARKGSVADAIRALQAMIKAGRPLRLQLIADEKDFDSIRDDPVFKKFLDENKGA